MIYFKKLHCDKFSEINQEMLSYIQSTGLIDHSKAFWNTVPVFEFMKHTPLFVNWLLQNRMPIKSIAVTIGHNENCCGPHIDTPPSIYKLSWPVLNTEFTFNRWFKEVGSCDKIINDLGGIVYTDPTQLEEVDRTRVDSPAIISTGVPHDVWIETLGHWPRIGLQCQFVNEPKQL